LRDLGFEVGFDKNTKQVVINPKILKLNVDGVEKVVEAIIVKQLENTQIKRDQKC